MDYFQHSIEEEVEEEKKYNFFQPSNSTTDKKNILSNFLLTLDKVWQHPSSIPNRKHFMEVLIKDTNIMMDVILPVCHKRPNVYHYLSKKASEWILQIEEEIKNTGEQGNSSNSFTTPRRKKQQQYSEPFACTEAMNNTTNNNESSSLSIGEDKRFLIEFLSGTTSNTIHELLLDLVFLKKEKWLYPIGNNSLRIRETIQKFCKELESDIVVFESLRRKESKDWKTERDLLLSILIDLEERIHHEFNHRRQNRQMNTIFHQLNDDSHHYPYANVYNQILTRYLSHTRSLDSNNNNTCSYTTTITTTTATKNQHYFRWKRPERPTSQVRYDDIHIIDDILTTLMSADNNNNTSLLLSSAASIERVRLFLQALRQRCHDDAITLSSKSAEEEKEDFLQSSSFSSKQQQQQYEECKEDVDRK